MSFRYEGIRKGDCWRYDLNVYAKFTGSGQFTYRWLVNGEDHGRKIATAPTEAILPSITWKKEGPHQVVFKVITPESVQRGITVDICSFDDF